MLANAQAQNPRPRPRSAIANTPSRRRASTVADEGRQRGPRPLGPSPLVHPRWAQEPPRGQPMSPDLMPHGGADLPMLALGVVLIFAAGVATGWHLARNVTGYMLGGRR